MRYTGDLGCKYRGIPHDLKIINESSKVKREVCTICNKRFKWNKAHKGRINSHEYLKAHVRNFAQNFGLTKRVYQKIYKPENCIIKL